MFHFYHHSRFRRYISRPYLYPLLFIVLLFLLIRWNSTPDPGTTGARFFDYIDQNRVVDEDGRIVLVEESGKRVIQAPRASAGEHLAGEETTTTRKKANTVHLAVYMEAQCPDTTGFIRRQLLPAWSRMGSTGRLNVTIVPFGKATCTRLADGDYQCECQHGKDECELNQLMNCAIELLPDPDSFIPLIGCIQGKDNLQAAFKSCLAGHSSSDWLWKCTMSEHGRSLLAQSGLRTAAIGDEFNFVPWVVLDGVRDNDAFYALEENFCKRFTRPKPLHCVKFKS